MFPVPLTGTSVAMPISCGLPQTDLSFTEIARRSLPSRPAVGRDVCSELTDPLYRDLTR
ncbi:hypothetical protein ACFQ6V_00505 [Streptomyces roseifaciens]